MSAPALAVRAATPDDLPTVLALMQAFYAEERLRFDPAATQGAVHTLLDDAACGAILLLGAEAELGYVALTRGFSLEQGGHYVLLDELYVAPSTRGQGLGAQALEVAAAHARTWGASVLRLEVQHHNPRAKALYLRAGFVDGHRDLLGLDLHTSR